MVICRKIKLQDSLCSICLLQLFSAYQICRSQ